MPRRTTDDGDDAAPVPGGGPSEAEIEAEEVGGGPRPSAAIAIAPPPSATSSSPITTSSPSTGVENHPSPDSAPVPVAQTADALEMEEICSKRGVEEIVSSGEDIPVPIGMMDTSYDRAEKGAGKKSVELIGDTKVEAKKASSGAASRKFQARAAAIIDSKIEATRVRGDASPGAELGDVQTRLTAGPHANVEGGRLEPSVRPPPPSMIPDNASVSESTEPSVPILQARLVEDESERPVYDAIPLEEEHWAKRHQRKIVGGFVLVIIALAIAFGVTFGVGGGGSDDGEDASTPPTNQPSMQPRPCFTDREELLAAVGNYTAGGVPCWKGDSECEVIQTYGWPIGSWCTSNVTSMDQLFRLERYFDDDLSSWDTSRVTSMRGMFNYASAFNGDVSNFDTSKVTDMNSIFRGASSFDGDVSDWDTSNVISMAAMFQSATSFNGDVGGFNTSKVISMAQMFYGAYSFNQDVSRWDVASVTGMLQMFFGATTFNQNLCTWGAHYNDTIRDHESSDWIDDFDPGPYDDMFSETNCPSEGDPLGPDTNWCAATCDGDVQTPLSPPPSPSHPTPLTPSGLVARDDVVQMSSSEGEVFVSVLDNDAPAPGDDLVVDTIVSQPTQGKCQISLDLKAVAYILETDGFTGTERCVYETCGDIAKTRCDTAVLTITVN